jgi:hypothetical protein
MRIEQFEIAERFCGPPRSGNGGYVCGRLARHLPGAVAARLKAPPPLNTALRLESSADQARLFHGDALLGEARTAPLDIDVPPCPSFPAAERAAKSYAGFAKHPFPRCFVCGPERAPNDGLRVFPGALDASATLAAPWIPDASLADESGAIRPEFLWSVLDCAGGLAYFPLADGVAIVLGELAAAIHAGLRAGDRCVVLGWAIRAEGRKRLAGSAIYAPDGRLAAVAHAVWVEVPASVWS